MKQGILALALVLTVAFSGCITPPPTPEFDVWQVPGDCNTIGVFIPLSCLEPLGAYVVDKIEVWDDLVKYKVPNNDPAGFYCNSLINKNDWEFYVDVCPGFYWQGKQVSVRVTVTGPVDLPGLTHTFELEDTFYQLACPLTIVTGTGWDPQQPGDWLANGRYGDVNTYELEVGIGPGLRTTGEHAWVNATPAHFILEFNGLTKTATFTVGSDSVTYTTLPVPANPCAAITKLMIHAKANYNGRCDVTNLVLNGASIGSPNGISAIGTADTQPKSYLRITTDCYLTYFKLEGDVTFTWDSITNTADESPGMPIFVEYS